MEITRSNNKIIQENRALQQNAEQIKVAVSDFAINIIHNLDLGIRSYALFEKDKYLNPMRFALRDKDSIMHVVEDKLQKQQYPMQEFYILKDSINAYANFCSHLLKLLDEHKREAFMYQADLDKGYKLWLQYEKFSMKVFAFEDGVNQEAQERYEAALQNNFLVQILLLVISVPTLTVTSILTWKKFLIEIKLRKTEEEKNHILAVNNDTLQHMVQERTKEIEEKNKVLQLQHEEITAQNEEIITQNEELSQQREALEEQNQLLIASRKEQLDLYTQNLLEKSRIIEEITGELELLRKWTDTNQVSKFNDILNSHLVTEEDWERFKKAFDQVYPEFFAQLRYRFVDITVAELRLAALIKINLSTKEAANSLGISAESVKKSRYRLKRKIGLSNEESLEKFIRSI